MTDLTVVDRRITADQVVVVELADPAGRRLPDWTPGAHIDLHLSSGHVRQYSLCGPRTDGNRYRIAVLREAAGRGGSAFVHDHLKVGDLVSVGGPRNNFRLRPATEYLFIGGGIGITPLMAMIEAAEGLETPWRLLYGGRSVASMAFLDELEHHGPRVTVVPEDQQGRLDLRAALESVGTGSRVYACGPRAMLDALADQAERLACTDRVTTELFQPKGLSAPQRETAFDVVLQRTGHTVRVTPDVTVLAAVRSAGVNVLSSCGEGVCGTCEATVLSGTPDHRDSVLGAADREAGDTMMLCVSRSLDDHLLLDL